MSDLTATQNAALNLLETLDSDVVQLSAGNKIMCTVVENVLEGAE